MEYIILTNTFRRSIDLVERSLKSSLNQKIEPRKVILIDQNDPPLKLSKELKIPKQKASLILKII